jgi:hypothetical protein
MDSLSVYDIILSMQGQESPQKLAGLREQLTTMIDGMIDADFHGLVQFLYRIDINEARLKRILADTEGENAASTIADLVIERQLEKIKLRQAQQNDPEIPDEEKW